MVIRYNNQNIILNIVIVLPPKHAVAEVKHLLIIIQPVHRVHQKRVLICPMCRRVIQQIDNYLQKYGTEIANKLESQQRQPPLYFAINLPDDNTCLTIMKKLVAKGANPKFKDQNEQTIIFYACRDGKAECVNYLIKLGVSLYEEDAYGQTPLYYIASQNQLNLLHHYDRPEHLNHRDKLAEQTPLYYAAKKGYLEMCKALVEKGTDVGHHDSHNKTAVEYARRARYHQVTQFLSNQAKKARDIKAQQQQISKENSKVSQGQTKKAPQSKKQISMQPEPISNIPRSFYKIVYVNDQGQTRDLTEEDVRNLVREKPGIQTLLANPGAIPRELLEGQKQEKWQKVAGRILNNCWKHKGSVWFQEAVDPVKFGILDYNDIITHPMDLGTIRKKLTFNFYASPQLFANDVKLVWQNCYKYNGEDHQISHCAKQLEILFERQYAEHLKPYETK